MKFKVLFFWMGLIFVGLSDAYASLWFDHAWYNCKDTGEDQSLSHPSLAGSFDLLVQSFNSGDYVIHQLNASNANYLPHTLHWLNKNIHSWESVQIRTEDGFLVQEIDQLNRVAFKEQGDQLILDVRYSVDLTAKSPRRGLKYLAFKKICTLRFFPNATLTKGLSSLYVIESKTIGFNGKPDFNGAVPELLTQSNVEKPKGRKRKYPLNQSVSDVPNSKTKPEPEPEIPAKSTRIEPVVPPPSGEDADLRELNSLSAEEALAAFGL